MLPLITGECDFESFGSMFMVICANGYPYKIDGGQEVYTRNLRTLAKGLSTYKGDAGVYSLPIFFFFIFKFNYFICLGIFVN